MRSSISLIFIEVPNVNQLEWNGSQGEGRGDTDSKQYIEIRLEVEENINDLG